MKKIPEKIESVLDRLKEAGHEAYLVGGSVRDLIMGKKPKDWDMTTDAKPEEIIDLFNKTFYENKFGTVTVILEDETEVEITPYRIEGKYSDKRHPDEIKFADSLEEDLSRRDFTINAIAFSGDKIVDIYEGQKDIEKKIVRSVGDSSERFSEDALRMLRAIRFAVQLNFDIDQKTKTAIEENHTEINEIASERIREELDKIVGSDYPKKGFSLMEETGLLQHIIPELREGIGEDQSGPHDYTIFEHSIEAVQTATSFTDDKDIRWAALLHDIGKARTKEEKPDSDKMTFYGHEVVSAEMTEDILGRLKFSNNRLERIKHLVRHHMFYYDIEEVSESGVRRLLRRVGRENFDDLMTLRLADRKAIPVPKAKPYKLRHLEFMVDKVSKDPISVSQLAIDGNDVMEVLDIGQSPRVGLILKALLAEVLKNPDLNKEEKLKEKAKEFDELSDQKLKEKLDFVEKKEQERIEKLKEKHHVD